MSTFKFSSIEFVDDLPTGEPMTKYETEIPYYICSPNHDASTFKVFCESIDNKIAKLRDRVIAEHDESDIEHVETIVRLLPNLDKSDWNKNINTIYAYITYPLDNPAIVKFERSDKRRKITYKVLMYAYTKAYQMVYALEDADNTPTTPGLMNTSHTHGRYGIWGHYIDALIYNGSSLVQVYDDSIVCEFDCDS
jgi:hypothetical protein